MSDLERIVWLDGTLVGESEARVSPFDHGLLTGDGVFETLKTYRGKPFGMGLHYQRLVRSATALGISVPGESVLREAITAILEANKLAEGRVRITLTGGVAPLGSGKGATPDTAIVAVSPLGAIAPTGDLWTVEWTRNETGALAGFKTTSYGENVRALAYAVSKGGSEAVLANTQGHLCEGTGSNVFLVLNGRLVTPPLSSGCLPGVTRAVVLRICEEMGRPAEEVDIPFAAIHEAEEMFVSSTIREVQPIASVDKKNLPACPGPVSEQVQAGFEKVRGLFESGDSTWV